MVTVPKSRKAMIVAALGVVILVALGLFLWHRHSTATQSASTAHTTSRAATAQSDYTSGNNRPTSSSNSLSQGGAIDQKGDTGPVSTPANQWTTSSSGAITLQQPNAGATLASGDVLSGTAKVSSVQYRLVDDQQGVIAQGALSVVDGKFAGKLQFKSYSDSGKLSTYSLDPNDGTEINHADVSVTFAR